MNIESSHIIPGDFIIPVSGESIPVKNTYPPNLNLRTVETSGKNDFVIPISGKRGIYEWAKDTSLEIEVTPLQWNILNLRFGEGESQLAVAKHYGVTRECIKKQEKSALKKIAKHIIHITRPF